MHAKFCPDWLRWVGVLAGLHDARVIGMLISYARSDNGTQLAVAAAAAAASSRANREIRRTNR